MKRFLLFVLIFLVPSVEVTTIATLWATASNPSPFFEQVRAEMEKTTPRHRGLVIWIDRVQHQQEFFGDSNLLQEKFLPGSTMKLITAEAALNSEKDFTYQCSGHDKIEGKRMHCWTYLGHGLLNLPQALGVSCNLFFARLGLALGKEKLLAQLDPYPFLEKNSLNKDKLRGAALANFAIGNSPDFQVTPQEMAKFWNQYLDKISTPAFAPIQQGLVRSAQGGTAARASASGIQILGKTGTGASMKKSYKTNAWFLGAYPTVNPRYALVVFLQEGYGFREAAGLAGKIFSLAQENGVLGK